MLDWKEEIRRRLASLKLEPTREAEIIEELAEHLEDRYRELVTGGATDDQASAVVLAELSDSPLLTNELRRVERAGTQEPVAFGSNTKSNMLTGLWQDLRYGLRMIFKRPGFSVIAITSLAIGIGAHCRCWRPSACMV